MIPSGAEVYLALAPIDLRWGFERLSGLVQQHVGRSPRSGALFVFYGKRRTALKVLFYDGTGMCQLYKRLDKGSFRIPDNDPSATHVELSERELDALLEGISVESRAAPNRTH